MCTVQVRRHRAEAGARLHRGQRVCGVRRARDRVRGADRREQLRPLLQPRQGARRAAGREQVRAPPRRRRRRQRDAPRRRHRAALPHVRRAAGRAPHARRARHPLRR